MLLLESYIPFNGVRCVCVCVCVYPRLRESAWVADFGGGGASMDTLPLRPREAFDLAFPYHGFPNHGTEVHLI